MRVGLVRHFKVKKDIPKQLLISQSEVLRWFEEYDHADIEEGTVDLGNIDWKRCYASKLDRAVRTAHIIYPGNVEKRKELREIQIYPFFKRDVKLPFLLWAVLVRMALLLDHKSQLERKTDVNMRIQKVLDEVLSHEEDVLIVGHGALMIFMRKELLRRGFRGPNLKTPKNGKLYLFEKE